MGGMWCCQYGSWGQLSFLAKWTNCRPRTFTRKWLKETGESAVACIRVQQLLPMLAGDTAWVDREQLPTEFGSSSQALNERREAKRVNWSEPELSPGDIYRRSQQARKSNYQEGIRARFPAITWRGLAERVASPALRSVGLLLRIQRVGVPKIQHWASSRATHSSGLLKDSQKVTGPVIVEYNSFKI